jgi:hypothetical protein
MNGLARDIRFALRALWKSPGALAAARIDPASSLRSA